MRRGMGPEEIKATIVLREAEIARIDASAPGVSNDKKAQHYRDRERHFAALAAKEEELAMRWRARAEERAEELRAEIDTLKGALTASAVEV